MIRRGIIQIVPNTVMNDKDILEVKMNVMWREFKRTAFPSYEEFKELIETTDYPMFDGVQLKVDVRLVPSSEWDELTYKAKAYDEYAKNLEIIREAFGNE